MDLLKKSGIMVPNYKVAHTPDEAFQIAQEFGKTFHIKAVLLFCNERIVKYFLINKPLTCMHSKVTLNWNGGQIYIDSLTVSLVDPF